MKRRAFLSFVAVACLGLVGWFAWWCYQRNRWFALRELQWAEIDKLREVPPVGWTDNAWQNTVTLAHNVWGNTIYIPESASENEMQELLARLRNVVRDVGPQNSLEAVRCVYDILLEREPNSDFIRGYRDSIGPSSNS